VKNADENGEMETLVGGPSLRPFITLRAILLSLAGNSVYLSTGCLTRPAIITTVCLDYIHTFSHVGLNSALNRHNATPW